MPVIASVWVTFNKLKLKLCCNEAKTKVLLMIGNYEQTLFISLGKTYDLQTTTLSRLDHRKATPWWEEEMGAWMYCTLPAAVSVTS